jgi:hypothetical protein
MDTNNKYGLCRGDISRILASNDGGQHGTVDRTKTFDLMFRF